MKQLELFILNLFQKFMYAHNNMVKMLVQANFFNLEYLLLQKFSLIDLFNYLHKILGF